MTTPVTPLARSFQRGRRLFTLASILLILTAVLHSIGHFAPVPPNTPLEMITEEMAAARFPMGMGMHPSMMDIFKSISLTMAIALAWLGFQNLTAAGGSDGGVVRRQAWLSAVCGGVLTWIYWHYRVPPPLISMGVVELLFIGALISGDKAPVSL